MLYNMKSGTLHPRFFLLPLFFRGMVKHANRRRAIHVTGRGDRGTGEDKRGKEGKGGNSCHEETSVYIGGRVWAGQDTHSSRGRDNGPQWPTMAHNGQPEILMVFAHAHSSNPPLEYRQLKEAHRPRNNVQGFRRPSVREQESFAKLPRENKRILDSSAPYPAHSEIYRTGETPAKPAIIIILIIIIIIIILIIIINIIIIIVTTTTTTTTTDTTTTTTTTTTSSETTTTTININANVMTVTTIDDAPRS
ncbi:hypothetical protein EGW08_011078 [Elysia chlorotica]|uniref:Uncharacterized protein n=1 Tax=Elysia chlorotica TaxID=188477 RepID=A0A3S1B6U1_ELYCH|nr:hypothetical protein EGW08_011078 [Elysia chlorotica]